MAETIAEIRRQGGPGLRPASVRPAALGPRLRAPARDRRRDRHPRGLQPAGRLLGLQRGGRALRPQVLDRPRRRLGQPRRAGARQRQDPPAGLRRRRRSSSSRCGRRTSSASTRTSSTSRRSSSCRRAAGGVGARSQSATVRREAATGAAREQELMHSQGAGAGPKKRQGRRVIHHRRRDPREVPRARDPGAERPRAGTWPPARTARAAT